MSRSKRYPVHTVSNQIDKSRAHRRVRKQVKQLLQTMDFSDPPIDIEADTRSIGAEEYGTKFGFDTTGLIDEERIAQIEEDERRASRK